MSPAKVIRFCTMRPIWSPRAPRMAAVSADSLEARAPLAFSSLSNQPTSCAMPGHQPAQDIERRASCFMLETLYMFSLIGNRKKLGRASHAKVDSHGGLIRRFPCAP